MKDLCGRDINYLRISITDRCNLRCKYCMPSGITCVDMKEILTMEEILFTARAASAIGIRHIKVTGGEPLVRLGCAKLVRELKMVPGIETVTLTTNGILLGDYLEDLIDAGIDAINISMDTTNEKLFAEITGGGDLKRVLLSMHLAVKAGVRVKINTVTLDWTILSSQYKTNYLRTGWEEMLDIAKQYPIDVRFIEVMPIGLGANFPSISHEDLIRQMKQKYPMMHDDGKEHGFGPAKYYFIPGFKGSIGFISAIHGKFCQQCNRVRLTSQGYLKSCLCFEDGVDLKRILRSDETEQTKYDQLIAAIKKAIMEKPGEHCFETTGEITETGVMSSIGG